MGQMKDEELLVRAAQLRAREREVADELRLSQEISLSVICEQRRLTRSVAALSSGRNAGQYVDRIMDEQQQLEQLARLAEQVRQEIIGHRRNLILVASERLLGLPKKAQELLAAVTGPRAALNIQQTKKDGRSMS